MPRRHRLFVRMLSIGVVGAGWCALSGCSGSGTSTADFRNNPTPRIMGAAKTGDEVANAFAYNNDTQWRLFNEDVARFFLLDRPNRGYPNPKGH